MSAHQRAKWIHRISLTLATLGALAPYSPACANQTAQYSVTAWGHKDGLPSTFIYAIAQTDDGFLWLGTADGLVRFDGVQFTPWRLTAPDGQPLGQVRTLNVSRNGDLLLGTGTGLLGRMQSSNLQIAQLHSAVESIEESRDGSLWVATLADLWHLNGSNLQSVDPPRSMPKGWLSGPLEGKDGKVWITTHEGVFYIDNRRLVQSGNRRSWLFRAPDGNLALLDQRGTVHSLENRTTDRRSSGLLHVPATIAQVMADRNGYFWIALRGGGVIHIAPTDGQTSAQQFTRDDGLSSNFASSTFEDREHNLWVATENGLNRLRRNDVLSLTRRDGLLSDTVTSVGAGEDGSVWLATAGGLERIREGSTAVYLKGSDVLSLLVGRNQQIWAGTTLGLVQWRDGHLSTVEEDTGFSAITALAEDGTGTLWFYDDGKGLFRQQSGQAPTAVTEKPLQHQAVTSMVSGAGNDVWFGLASGDILVHRNGEFHAFSKNDGLPAGAIHDLALDRDGGLWAATERGLCFMAADRFVCRNAENGLPGDRVLWAIPDGDGNIWLGYNMGVARMSAQELHGSPTTGSAQPHWKLFDDGDGLENSPTIEGNAPAALARDGRLWLTTSQGVAVFDPRHLRTNLLPPPVHILGLQADGRDIALSGQVRLPPLTRSVQFSYTALSLSDPRKIRFRYRLDGFDREWHEGGARRDAFYTNLPPRRYTFRVCAANNDGVWNDTGAALNFSLAPAYFQTVWFRLSCIGAALLGMALVLRAQLRSAKRTMRLRYEERMEERARIAQELHDNLIQEMVGISMQLEVADELTSGDAGAKNPLRRALGLSRSAIASGRLTLQSLRSRPVRAAAFVETLKATAEAYPEKNRMAVEYRVEGEEQLLRPEIAEDLSELGQEALRNALKHAGHVSISVRLVYSPASVELSIHDEGSGIADALLQAGRPGHYGLAGMRERAARMSAAFAIRSSSDQGTTVLVSVPAGRAYQEIPLSDNGSSFGRLIRKALHRNSAQETEK
jgi:signal transduction histidine kinase/ligand-binding sensor domain-containing protein